MQPMCAVLFDLDGVLTDTAELHFQSWQALADSLGIGFDRKANEALRGLSREESLARVLGPRSSAFSEGERRLLTARKNDDYLERVARMTPADLLPGAGELLKALRALGVATAVASSSRNARVVLKRLGISAQFHAVVDGNDAPRSKPDPQVFLVAAETLGVPPRACVVIEDAESGVDAALAAEMRVVGVGPRERVGRAHRVVASLCEISAEQLIEMAGSDGVRT